MAIIWDASQACPLCGGAILDAKPVESDGELVVQNSRPIISFPYVAIGDPRFMRIDESNLHQACLDGWELRDEFVDAWNEHCKSSNWGPLLKVRNSQVYFRIDWSEVLGGVVFVAFLPFFAAVEFVHRLFRRPRQEPDAETFPVTHVEAEADEVCPHCDTDAAKYRQLSCGSLVCPSCGRSFERKLVESAQQRTEPQSPASMPDRLDL